LAREKNGLLMVYTGDGKGKTTAALGLALRAIGHGKKVYMVQFMKGSRTYGEILAAERYLPHLTIVPSGRTGFVNRQNPDSEDIRLAGQALELGREALTSGNYQLVIWDEVNVALDYGLIGLKDVLAALEQRPDGVDLVLTGRNAPEEVITRADLVSEVRQVKHHYEGGVQAKAGIEY